MLGLAGSPHRSTLLKCCWAADWEGPLATGEFPEVLGDTEAESLVSESCVLTLCHFPVETSMEVLQEQKNQATQDTTPSYLPEGIQLNQYRDSCPPKS